MRRFIPQSVSGRVFLALFFVVVLINVTSLFFYVVFRDEAAGTAAASQAADQIIVIKRMLERTPKEENKALIDRFISPVMSLALTRGRPIVQESDNQLTSRVVLDKLRTEFVKGTDIRVDSRIEEGGFQPQATIDEMNATTPFDNQGPVSVPVRSDVPPVESSLLKRLWQRLAGRNDEQQLIAMRNGLPGLNEALFRVSILAVKPGDRVGDGSLATEPIWLNARVILNVGEPRGQYVPFLWLTAVSVVIGLIAFWGVRRATVPLSVFASAAERLGVDVNSEPISEEGPSEVQRAARAFNTMQLRVKRFIQDRTQMLAAISHDLRTPITRLRLRAEFVDDDVQRRKVLADLDEMEAMISATLVFARDDAANEPATHIDGAAVVAHLCSEQSAAGRQVAYSGPDSCDLVARPLALKRAINNFVDNAVKYGKTARVTLIPGDSDVTVFIDDDGPGIAPGDMERVFAPFTRLERSRSRETGGAGLGMTIARNAIRSMGGDVELINRPEGGLRVKVTLPVAQMELLAAAE